jgi:hypothetical protein
MESAKSVTFAYQETTGLNTEWSKILCDLTLRVKTQCIRTILTQLMGWRRPSQNTFRLWTVLYWTRSSRTQFCVWINVCRLAGEILNITCNGLYCNHQVHWDFLITLSIKSRRQEILLGLITAKPRYNVTTFIAHTTIWTETISFTLSGFTTANCSEQTENIFNPHFIVCVGGDFALADHRRFNCDSWAVKAVLENIGVVEQNEPSSTICKL